MTYEKKFTIELFKEKISGTVGSIRLVELWREAVRDGRVGGRGHGDGQAHADRRRREKLEFRWWFRQYVGLYL